MKTVFQRKGLTENLKEIMIWEKLRDKSERKFWKDTENSILSILLGAGIKKYKNTGNGSEFIALNREQKIKQWYHEWEQISVAPSSESEVCPNTDTDC